MNYDEEMSYPLLVKIEISRLMKHMHKYARKENFEAAAMARNKIGEFEDRLGEWYKSNVLREKREQSSLDRLRIYDH